MSTYRKTWACCGDTTETDAWEPTECPFCAVIRLSELRFLRQDQAAQLAAPAAPVQEYKSVATVLYLDGEKIIDGSLAFMDAALAGTELYAAQPAQGECE